VFSASTLHIHLTIQYLFYLFLLVLRLLAEQVPSWWVVVLHKTTLTTGVGVSVTKVQHPWTVVVAPLKDWDSTLTGLHHKDTRMACSSYAVKCVHCSITVRLVLSWRPNWYWAYFAICAHSALNCSRVRSQATSWL
jgi:hypothetical protein